MSSPQGVSRDDLVVVARAVRIRGLKGELVAELLTDFPERFETTSRLFGVSPAGEISQLELENHWLQNGRLVLKFVGYDSVEAAKTLIGFEFAILEAERVELGEGEFYDWELEGCVVENTDGVRIGEVREVMRTGGVEILVVKAAGTNDVLVPMVASIVIKVDV